MKPYQSIPIHDCGEPLVPIPLDRFAVVQPHPYEALGAPYGERSPYFLRVGVLDALVNAQENLTSQRLGWKIQIFDAFRPIPVQQFMVDYTFQELLQGKQLKANQLTAEQRKALMEDVFQFWALPSHDPATPPPHSTGAALDVTLVDDEGQPLDMGSPIDEVSPRSFPEHFAASQDPQQQNFHTHRALLNQVMESAGFCRHPKEWWHFSLGDQLWAWILRQKTGNTSLTAKYGRLSEES
jgi:D-alanyl-D-alanine dipeptidase